VELLSAFVIHLDRVCSLCKKFHIMKGTHFDFMDFIMLKFYWREVRICGSEMNSFHCSQARFSNFVL
jgi:hypothetical protein